jgi:cobyric acid synthase
MRNKSMSPKKVVQHPQKAPPMKSVYDDEKEKLRNLAKIILKGSKNTGKEKEILEKKKFILENLLKSVEMQIQQLKSN